MKRFHSTIGVVTLAWRGIMSAFIASRQSIDAGFRS